MYYREIVVHQQSVEMIDNTIYEWQTLVAALIGPVIREVGQHWPASTEPLHWVSLGGELSDLFFLSFNRSFLPRFEKMPLGLKEQAVHEVLAFLSVPSRRAAVDAYGASSESVPIQLLSDYLARRLWELKVYLSRCDASATFAKRTTSAVQLRLFTSPSWQWHEFDLAKRRAELGLVQAELMVASKGVAVTLRSVSDQRPSIDEVVAVLGA